MWLVIFARIEAADLWHGVVQLDQQFGGLFPLLLAPGLLLLHQGWRRHKLFLLATGAVLGALLIHWLLAGSTPEGLAPILALVGGLLLGILALPFLFFYIFVVGGLFAWGLLNLASLAAGSGSFPISEPASLLVLALGGLLALSQHRSAIIFITSFVGAALTVLGALAILHALAPTHFTQTTAYIEMHRVLAAYVFGFLTCLGTFTQKPHLELPAD